jgi:hypothetical protein
MQHHPALIPRRVHACSIEAAGAAGGASTYSGGVGAAVSGHVRLTAGTVLYILIGQTGLPGPDAGGGGGGTYILIGDRDTPLMVAGADNPLTCRLIYWGVCSSW